MIKTINGVDFEIPKEFSFVEFSDDRFNSAFLEIFSGNRNLFIQGRAGSGKSLLIKMISKMLDNTIILSTTGITAMNLTTDDITAYTVHSFLSLGPTDLLNFGKKQWTHINHKFLELLRTAECIVIDEISMLSNIMFDISFNKIFHFLRKIPRVILFGDIMQAPPVIRPEDVQFRKTLDPMYQNQFMFFNSKWYKDMKAKTITLEKSFRQQDEEFAKKLFQIGFNDYDQSTLDYFNSRVMSREAFEKQSKNFVYITPLNRVVNEINNAYLASLTGEERLYTATISEDWPPNLKIPDKEILLKEGAQVICTTNRQTVSPEGEFFHRYRNGQIGHIIKLEDDCVWISSNGKRIKVMKGKNPNMELVSNNNKFELVQKGWYAQIDCKVAKAITIHKSQGKTIDREYFIPGNWLPEGLVYVALSRVTSLGGLALSRPITEKDIRINEESFEFLEGF